MIDVKDFIAISLKVLKAHAPIITGVGTGFVTIGSTSRTQKSC